MRKKLGTVVKLSAALLALAAPASAQTIDATLTLASSNHPYGLGGVSEPVMVIDVDMQTELFRAGTFTKWRAKDFTVSETDLYLALTPSVQTNGMKLSADVRYWRNNIVNPREAPQFIHQELASTVTAELPHITATAFYTFGLEGTHGKVFEGCVSSPIGPFSVRGCELHNNKFYTKETGHAMRSIAISSGTCVRGLQITASAQQNFSQRDDYRNQTIASVSIGACEKQ